MRTITVMFLVCGLATAQANSAARPDSSAADANQLSIPSGTKVPAVTQSNLFRPRKRP